MPTGSIVCIVLIIIILLWYFYGRRHVIKASYDKQEEIMSVTWSDGSESKFSGRCTVWHELPYMTRCSTPTESLLCDLWEYCKQWDGAYPDAHKKQPKHG